MKLIATLATLAALVGQTEAVQSDAHVESVIIGNAPCTDKVTLTVKPNANLAAGTTFYFSSTKLTTNSVAQVLTDATTTSCDTADAKDATTGFGAVPTYASGKWNFTVGTTPCDLSASGDAGKVIRVTLDNVCNNGVTDYTGMAIGLKFKTSLSGAAELDSDQTAAAADLSGTGATAKKNAIKLANFTVVDMPVAASTEGPFKATWIGVTGLNSLNLVLNLPKDYKISGGSTCNITSAKTSPTIVTLRASSVTTDSTTNSIVFGTPIAASTLDATSKTTLNCDKVKSGAEIAANVDDAVSVKAHATGTFAGNTHVAYARANTPAPTAKPTAKSADSPASVATASGVVVGALGVAALFLA